MILVTTLTKDFYIAARTLMSREQFLEFQQNAPKDKEYYCEEIGVYPSVTWWSDFMFEYKGRLEDGEIKR